MRGTENPEILVRYQMAPLNSKFYIMAKTQEKSYKMPGSLFFKSGMSPEEKAQMIMECSAGSEEQTVKITFTEEEIQEKKDEQVSIATEISDLEKEKAAVTAEFGAKLKPLREKQKGLLTAIREGHEHDRIVLYKIINFKERKVGFYDIEGKLYHERDIRKDESQMDIEDKVFVDPSMHE